jgi:nucleotide-binding universal stress UspA family protein
MAYKSLVTFVASEAGMQDLLDKAITLARRFDAHLEVCALGVDSTQSMGFYAGAPAVIYHQALDAAQATARLLQEKCDAHLRNAGIRYGTDGAVLSLGGLNAFVGMKARFADLVVLPRPYGDGRTLQDEVITEASLFEGGAPVLVVPSGAQDLPEFRRIVLAWNQSAEAIHATRAALPLLQDAELVNLVIVNPPAQGAERSDPGGMLATLLVRHGVEAEVSVVAKTLPRTSDVLRRHLLDKDAQLMVMGAYGRSRLREAILGGATREMLEGCESALFLAR